MKGDKITIVEVRGTADTFTPGHIYWIKGTYTLASCDRATLAAYTTAMDPADGTGTSFTVQKTEVTRGNGAFTLFLPMSCRGWPHVSFYGTEDSGGIYFGTGDSVLKQWWGSKGEDKTRPAAQVDSLYERVYGVQRTQPARTTDARNWSWFYEQQQQDGAKETIEKR